MNTSTKRFSVAIPFAALIAMCLMGCASEATKEAKGSSNSAMRYGPEDRESTNVEDRRPQSQGGPVPDDVWQAEQDQLAKEAEEEEPEGDDDNGDVGDDDDGEYGDDDDSGDDDLSDQLSPGGIGGGG